MSIGVERIADVSYFLSEARNFEPELEAENW